MPSTTATTTASAAHQPVSTPNNLTHTQNTTPNNTQGLTSLSQLTTPHSPPSVPQWLSSTLTGQQHPIYDANYVFTFSSPKSKSAEGDVYAHAYGDVNAYGDIYAGGDVNAGGELSGMGAWGGENYNYADFIVEGEERVGQP